MSGMSGTGVPGVFGTILQYQQAFGTRDPQLLRNMFQQSASTPRPDKYVPGRADWPLYGTPNPQDIADEAGTWAIRVVWVLGTPVVLYLLWIVLRTFVWAIR